MSKMYSVNPYLNVAEDLVTLNLTEGIVCLKNGLLKTPGLILDFPNKVELRKFQLSFGMLRQHMPMIFEIPDMHMYTDADVSHIEIVSKMLMKTPELQKILGNYYDWLSDCNLSRAVNSWTFTQILHAPVQDQHRIMMLEVTDRRISHIYRELVNSGVFYAREDDQQFEARQLLFPPANINVATFRKQIDVFVKDDAEEYNQALNFGSAPEFLPDSKEKLLNLSVIKIREEIFEALLKFEALIICAPTASGKSLLLPMFVHLYRLRLKRFQAQQDLGWTEEQCKLSIDTLSIVMVPTRAAVFALVKGARGLVEKFPDLFEGIKIGKAVGGDCLAAVEGDGNNLIFCTVGKAKAWTNMEMKLIERADTIFFDEVHELNLDSQLMLYIINQHLMDPAQFNFTDVNGRRLGKVKTGRDGFARRLLLMSATMIPTEMTAYLRETNDVLNGITVDIFHLTGETAREYLLHPVNLSDLKEMTSNQFDQMMKEQAITFDPEQDRGLPRIYAFEEQQLRGASEEHDVYIEGINIDGVSAKEFNDLVLEEEERKAAVSGDVDVLDMYEDPTEEVDDVVSAAAEVVGEPLEAESIACPPPTPLAAHQ